MKPTNTIKLVLLPVLVLILTACISRPRHSFPSMQIAADTAQVTATKLGYTAQNRLTEIDQCVGNSGPCFYTIYFTTTDDRTSFVASLKANGLVDPDPYETAQDIVLFTELGDSNSVKYYLPEFETERDKYLTVNGENPGIDPYGHAPLHSTMWQFQRQMETGTDGNINFILYEVSQVNESYTFAARPVTDNLVAVSVQHGR